MKRLLIVFSWLGFTSLTLSLTLAFYLNISQLPSLSKRPQLKYTQTEVITSHAVLPEVLGAFTFSVKSDDAIPEIIRNYLNRYQSPLLPFTDFLVSTARKYQIDPRLLVAIAQQESNLCKKIPDESHNCWGWGIHSQGTLKFTSYPEAIIAVTQGLAKNYLDKGLITPEEIMGIYTPLSQGSWAEGVQQFLNEMD